MAHVKHNSGNNEWYTPGYIVDTARRAMGGHINIDPASCETANQVVMAQRYYDADVDGLQKTWTGNVFLNPPYGRGLIETFVDKLLAERANFSQAIVLVNNATDTKWWQRLAQESNSVCFLAGRVKFLGQDLLPAKTPLQGQTVFYFGENVGCFKWQFRHMGVIWE